MLIHLDDIRLNVTLTGPVAGPPLVLLHALGTTMGLWDDLLPLLPPSLWVLRVDLRGHGGSDAPAPPYAMGALIRDVERVMQHVGMTGAVVVGCSLGGLVAQGLAIKRLDLVRAMVLSNSAVRIGTAELWSRRAEEVRRDSLAAYAPGAMLRMFGPQGQAHPALPRVRDMLTATLPGGWIGCAMAIAGTDFYAPTAALTLPTLVIAGARDATTPPDLVRETADLISGSQFALIQRAGHLPMVDQPAEFATLLDAFLTRIGHI